MPRLPPSGAATAPSRATATRVGAAATAGPARGASGTFAPSVVSVWYGTPWRGLNSPHTRDAPYLVRTACAVARRRGPRRRRRDGRPRAGRHGDLRSFRGRRLVRHALARADLAAAGRRAILRDDLGRRDDRALTADEGRERDRDLVVLDPDVLGLARHVTEPRVLDEEPARLGRHERELVVGRGLHAVGLTYGAVRGDEREVS